MSLPQGFEFQQNLAKNLKSKLTIRPSIGCKLFNVCNGKVRTSGETEDKLRNYQ